ncbi:MAG: sulfatase [Pseudomonadota bacterium]
MTHRAPPDKPLRQILPPLLGALMAGCAAPRPVSFLVISMDTFRADRLGPRGADGATLTPALDELAAESLVFTRAYAQANETLFSHAALFTGRYPSEIAPLDYRRFRLTPDAVTMAACLGLEGYRTEAVVAGGHLAPQFGLGAGFQRYLPMDDFSSFQQTEPVAVARLEELAADGGPFLLFVHGYDTHSPYVKPGILFRLGSPDYAGIMLDAARDPLTYERILFDRYFPDFTPTQITDAEGDQFLSPASFDELEALAAARPEAGIPLERADLDFLLHTYDAAARHADFFVGLLLDSLDEQGLADDTVVVVLGDHGEDLLEHGHFNHRLSLHDPNVHVPLLLRIPGELPERIDSAVALVDVAPTLLTLAGARERETRGRSLLDPLPGRAVYSESMRGDISVRDEQARLILRASAPDGWRAEGAPAGAWLGDDDGQILAWSDSHRATLGRALEALLP